MILGFGNTCQRGHPWSEFGRPYTKGGKTYHQCRKCAFAKRKLRYRNDPEYREKEKARALTRYYKQKETHLGPTDETRPPACEPRTARGADQSHQRGDRRPG